MTAEDVECDHEFEEKDFIPDETIRISLNHCKLCGQRMMSFDSKGKDLEEYGDTLREVLLSEGFRKKHEGLIMKGFEKWGKDLDV